MYSIRSLHYSNQIWHQIHKVEQDIKTSFDNFNEQIDQLTMSLTRKHASKLFILLQKRLNLHDSRQFLHVSIDMT